MANPDPTGSVPVQKVGAAACIAAPIVLAASTAVHLSQGSFYDSAAAGALQFLSMIFMVGAVFTLITLVSRLAPRATAVLGALAFAGTVAGAGFGVERIFTAAGFPQANELPFGMVLYMAGLLFPLAMVGFGVALAKLRPPAALAWTGWVLALGAVAFPMSRIPGIPALGLVADLLIASALVPLGWRVLQSREALAAPAVRLAA